MNHPLFFWQASRMHWWRKDLCDPNVIDEVMIGDYGDEKRNGVGELGEFAIRWHRLDGTLPSPRLEVFEDAWGCLATDHGKRLVAWLSSRARTNPSVEEVCRFLISIGVRDTSDVRLPKEGS